MFNSLFKLAENVVDIATAPVRVVVDAVDAVVAPIAEVANEVVEDIKDALDD